MIKLSFQRCWFLVANSVFFFVIRVSDLIDVHKKGYKYGWQPIPMFCLLDKALVIDICDTCIIYALTDLNFGSKIQHFLPILL